MVQNKTGRPQEAWQALYSKHGLQFGGSGNVGPLLDILRAGMVVLDAGCGEGKTTEILSRKAEVVGCDFSREGLLSLRSKRDQGRVMNLVECDLASLPFGQDKFDAVACVHSVSHMLEPGRRKAGEQLSSVLKPGGYLFAEGFGRNDFRFGEGQELERATFVRGNGIMTHYFEEGEMEHLFSGLTLVSKTAVTRRIAYGAKAGRRETLRALFQKPE